MFLFLLFFLSVHIRWIAVWHGRILRRSVLLAEIRIDGPVSYTERQEEKELESDIQPICYCCLSFKSIFIPNGTQLGLLTSAINPYHTKVSKKKKRKKTPRRCFNNDLLIIRHTEILILGTNCMYGAHPTTTINGPTQRGARRRVGCRPGPRVVR